MKLVSNERGVMMTEYVMLALLIAVIAIPAVGFFGSKTNAKYEYINQEWDTWVAPGGSAP